MRIERGVFAFAAAILMFFCVYPSEGAKMTAEEIVKNALKEYEKVDDYSVEAVITVESKKIHIPESVVEILYKKPDKLRIIGKSGFLVLPKGSLFKGSPISELLSAQKPVLTGIEKIMDSECYVLTYETKSEKGTKKTTVWVDSGSFLVRQIKAVPEKGSQMTMQFWYSRIKGKYLMPVKATIDVDFLLVEKNSGGDSEKKTQKMTAVIEFRGYRINRGLSDEAFVEDKK